MRIFLLSFLGVLAAVACIAAWARWSNWADRNQQADRLVQSSTELAAGCRAADRRTLAMIRSNLERSEELIVQARGWDTYSPEHEIKKAALHNRFVSAGCFRN